MSSLINSWPLWLAVSSGGTTLVADAARRRVASVRPRPFELLDALAVAGAASYAGWRLGELRVGASQACVLGMAAAAGLTYYLWRRGTRALLYPLPPGVIASEFLILLGVLSSLEAAVFPSRTCAVGAMGPLMSLGLVLAGTVLLVSLRRSARRLDPVHKVLDHVLRHGSPLQPEYHRPTPECPHPERWRMLDTMTAEVEVLEFLRCLVRTTKPGLVVETGTFLGISTTYMAQAMADNGFGRIITCDPDPEVFARARERIEASGLSSFIDYRCQGSLDITIEGTIDILFCDSLPELREPEVRHFLPRVSPYGLVLMHDASSHLKVVREAALRLEREGLISVVLLPTPRGLVIAQKAHSER
jgi:predicted O-methyltransferase YrrM